MNTYQNYVHTSTVFKYILVGGFVHAFDEPVCVCMYVYSDHTRHFSNWCDFFNWCDRYDHM